jgi:hypothetical protein
VKIFVADGWVVLHIVGVIKKRVIPQLVVDTQPCHAESILFRLSTVLD